jgi:hypothetical protein
MGSISAASADLADAVTDLSVSISSETAQAVSQSLGVVMQAAVDVMPTVNGVSAATAAQAMLESAVSVLSTLTAVGDSAATDAGLPSVVEQFSLALGSNALTPTTTEAAVFGDDHVAIIVARSVEAMNSYFDAFSFATSQSTKASTAHSSIWLPPSLFSHNPEEQTVTVIRYASDAIFPALDNSIVGSGVLAATFSGMNVGESNPTAEDVQIKMQLRSEPTPAQTANLRNRLAALHEVSPFRITNMKFVDGGARDRLLQFDMTNADGSVSEYLDSLQLSCAWWDQAEQSWATEGCRLATVDEAGITCNCSHLTNFAVLVDVNGKAPPRSSVEGRIVYTISIASCAIAILALAITLLCCFVYSRRQDLTKSQLILIHIATLLLL